MYAHFLSVLGPFQQQQQKAQLTPQEMSEALKHAKSPKDMIQFYKMFVTSMQFSCPENLVLDDISKTEIENKNLYNVYKKKNEIIFLHNFYFQFLLKYNIIINYFDYKLWDFENIQSLSKEDIQKFTQWKTQYQNCISSNVDVFICNSEDCICKKQSKQFFLQSLKNEIDELFQNCLEICKFESHEHGVDMKKKLKDEIHKYVYFTSILYFQDYIVCLLKLKNLNKSCHRIYEMEKDELECIEYDMELLEIFHKKTLNIENILSFGVLENMKPETCIYYISKI
jgi:hypothetical protein